MEVLLDVLGQYHNSDRDIALNHILLVKGGRNNPEAGWVVVYEVWQDSSSVEDNLHHTRVAFVTTKFEVLWSHPCFKGGI